MPDKSSATSNVVTLHPSTKSVQWSFDLYHVDDNDEMCLIRLVVPRVLAPEVADLVAARVLDI